jgi:ubiquinone/menaquinone biosynthesis C-methylase UbiE
MLHKGRGDFIREGMTAQIRLVQGDAHFLPINSDQWSLVLMSFALHLLPHPQIALFEVSRVLRLGGWFFLITYDLLDLGKQVYHRHFPKWYEIDSQRYLEIDALKRLMVESGLKVIKTSKYSYTIQHESVDALVNFVKSKPFSTMVKYSESEFQEAVKVFEKQLRLHFGSGEVEYASSVTLISSTKDE